MTAKIVEVLAQILDYLNNKNVSLDEINKKLVSQKEFDKQTVSAAFSLVYDKVLSKKVAKNKNQTRKNKNFRVLSNDEKELLGVDNFNYLVYLLNVGLIGTGDFELILEQILLFPYNTISKEDINWLVFISIIEFNADILPGSRVLLNSSDTIN
ncbi:MAG: DUF494 family protein [bacterium]